MSPARLLAPYRVLVIDDNRSIHEDFRKILCAPGASVQQQLQSAEVRLFGAEQAPAALNLPRYQLDFALQGEEGVASIAAARASGQPHALAFVDMRMPPGWDGLETIERLWREDPHVQVVICSAYSDYDWTDVVRRLGSSDRLLVIKKPFEPIEVLQCAAAMTHKWRQQRALRSRRKRLENTNRQLRHMATHDALTGLPNRVLLEERLNEQINACAEEGGRFAVLMVDLDRFKQINDTLGHHAGDLLLVEVARRLMGVVREGDTVARVGGDEFVLLVGSFSGTQDLTRLADRVNEALGEPLVADGIELRVGSSVGIACYPRDGMHAEELVARADVAMYGAKQRGRGTVQFYEASLDTGGRERVSFESELRGALERGELVLHYQPVIDTASGRIAGAEALVRWNHPARGLLSAAQFVPLAEDSGLIAAIGAWVLHEAARQAMQWRGEGLPAMPIAVNVSASQFRRGDLLQIVRAALDRSRLPPELLELELTESAVMTDPEASAGLLAELRCLGVQVALDDFGTGYSNMCYLRRFPISKLKIDRSFLKDLAVHPGGASLIAAIASLGRSLGLRVVAEGVEHREQLQLLHSIGCDQYQGYYFSAPVPAGHFAALLRDEQQASRSGLAG